MIFSFPPRKLGDGCPCSNAQGCNQEAGKERSGFLVERSAKEGSSNLVNWSTVSIPMEILNGSVTLLTKW